METRKFFLSVVFLASAFSSAVLVMAIFAVALYMGAESNFKGDFLLLVSEPKTLSILIFFSGLLIFKAIREDGREFWRNLLKRIEIMFDRLTENIK